MAKILACICGDCKHWEIIDKGTTPIGPSPTPIILKCMTCKHEFHATFSVDAHEKLTEIEQTAIKTAPAK